MTSKELTGLGTPKFTAEESFRKSNYNYAVEQGLFSTNSKAMITTQSRLCDALERCIEDPQNPDSTKDYCQGMHDRKC